ncbi:hypothetical protein BZG36_01388 [Bifiguratus adelaidae]|uniref:AB hydrolase-1 domain-containing protein n=1 Tax=Bifiguratus adelaidae TaxID=1938954 RepID=A0A261Y3C2_9FUNG|nr:hypothetical protein BZG36_01388 [Bifiguratus adelaidae]
MPKSGIQFYHHVQPVVLAVKEGPNARIKKDLVEYIKEACPSLAGPKAAYHPTPYLFNGHLQTFYAAFFKGSRRLDQVQYTREYLPTVDGGQILLDWTPQLDTDELQNKDSKRPILVVLHGLTGGSHESYVRNLLDIVTRPPYCYKAVVVNFRGCAESILTSPQLYCGAWTEDVRFAVKTIAERFPDSPLMGVGFSLGSNVLVKYLGEEEENTPLIAGISISNPWDFVSSSLWIDRTWFRRNIYSRTMAGNLVRTYNKHAKVLEQNKNLNFDYIQGSKTIREFDDRCTRIAFGYDTVNDYYRDASSSRFLKHVRVPLLCLNACDDPISPAECWPLDEAKVNPNVCFVATDHGGHIGWFQGFLSPRRWCMAPLAEFVHAMFDTKTN